MKIIPEKKSLAVAAALAPAALASIIGYASAQGPAAIHPVVTPSMPPLMQIPLEKALKIQIPKPAKNLTPSPFQPSKTLKGWVVEIPGNHPICTPAYYEGKLYVGGGYGSNDFFCFDAETGKLVWQYHTNDDGPTAAVVENGCVAFNTESCTVFVLDAATGKELWKEWLGDPLMSQPAIAQNRLFMAFPSGQRGHGVTGHALLCADLKTGKHLWSRPITSDVISSPVIEYDRVYLSCMDGTSYCFDTKTGAQVWKRQNAATSAPVIHDGQLIVSERGKAGTKTTEGIRRIDARRGDSGDKILLAAGNAPYISAATNGTIGPQMAAAMVGGAAGASAASAAYGGAHSYGAQSSTTVAAAKPVNASKSEWYKSMDSAVGFAAPPPNAQLSKAEANLGINSVAGAWGYQGARAAFHNGAVTNTQLTFVNSVDAKSGKMNWRAEAKGSFVTGENQVFSTPALGKKNLYLCSGNGHLVCMDQISGKINYMYATNEPISFQPALAKGKVYIGTANGKLICLSGDDADADGWTAWGGNAQHNNAE
ncbi:MAG TPA: PQQ-binding-like beta-propeller repeat protein [Chroococcales cyanobacterium]